MLTIASFGITSTHAATEPVVSPEQSLVAMTGGWVDLMKLDIESLDPATAELLIHRGVEPSRTGNAATHYFRALLFEPEVDETDLDENEYDPMDRVLYAPMEERLAALRDNALMKEIDTWSQAIQPIRAATTCSTSDWHVASEAGIAALLPELGRFRYCTRWHGLLGDQYLAKGQPWSALRCYREILAMGRDLGESNTLIGALVGMAIEAYGLARIEEATPYLIEAGIEPERLKRVVCRQFRRGPDLHKAMTGERIWVWSTLGPLRETSLDSGDAVWDALATAIAELVEIGMFNANANPRGAALKNDMIRTGMISREQAEDPKEVMALLIRELEFYQSVLDQYIAMIELDREDRERVSADLEASLENAAETKRLTGMIVPALGRVSQSVDRLTANRRAMTLGLAAITIRVESGQWPTLGDVRERWPEISVVNPSTGDTFEIRIEGSTMTIPWRFDDGGEVQDSIEFTLR